MALSSLAQSASSSMSAELTQTMESVGDTIINEYCKEYETTTTASYLLPPVMDSEYTEERNLATNTITKPGRVLTKYEEAKHIGILTEQTGEMCEYRVFTLFHQLVCKKQNYQCIVLRKFELDNNDNQSVEETELMNEPPTTDLSSVNMKKARFHCYYKGHWCDTCGE